MKVTTTDILDVLILEPRVHSDDRGFLFESWTARTFHRAVGFDVHFVADLHSHSRRGVLRGLHYQIRQPQATLVRASGGRIFDVAVDLRRSSPSFGRWVGVELSRENVRQMWIPAGLAHGFLVLSATAEVQYKVTDYYAPEHERRVIWNDPDLSIAWPLSGEPIVSEKDMAGLPLRKAEVYE